MFKTEDERLFAVILVVLIIVAAAFMYSIYIGRTPEAFTQAWLESYFDSARPGEEMNFSFVIDNHEEKAATYSYKIIVNDVVKKENSIAVDKGENRLVEESISFDMAGSEKQKVLVEINKPEKPEPYSLWFWVDVRE